MNQSTNQPINQSTDQLINQSTNHIIQYTLHLADTSLILAQRNSEWCGHGPILEQDIAITNISLDQLGQARNFYQYAAELINQSTNQPIIQSTNQPTNQSTEDSLAYLRTEREFTNLLIAELPNGDWAQTVLRQFLVSAYHSLLYSALSQSGNERLAAIAVKSLKEVHYHLKWSSEWVIRLGDGTTESNDRISNAIDELWSYTGELFLSAGFEKALHGSIAPDTSKLKEQWEVMVKDVFDEAGLQIPQNVFMQSGGKSGRHTENLGYILAEMQYLQRTYPGSEW